MHTYIKYAGLVIPATAESKIGRAKETWPDSGRIVREDLFIATIHVVGGERVGMQSETISLGRREGVPRRLQ